MFLTILTILWAIVWVLTLFDIFRRADMSTWAKVAWAAAVIVFPFVGALVYFIVRPGQPSDPRYPDGGGAPRDAAYERVQDRRPI